MTSESNQGLLAATPHVSSKTLEAMSSDEDFKITPKMQFVLIGNRLFHRVEGGWDEYE